MTKYIIGLVLVIGSEFLLRDFLIPISDNITDFHIQLAILAEWLVLLFLLTFWIPYMEQQTLRSIGFTALRWQYILIGSVVFLVVMVLSTASEFFLHSVGLRGFRDLQALWLRFHFSTRFLLFLTGTFLEEVFYRGYVIERITILTGRSWVGGLLSWFLFVLVHFKFFGLGPALEVGIIAAALVLLYLQTRSIWPGIVLHGLNNLFGYLIFPLLF
jgi:membrane protease YdiL (CAAX protease family)